MKSDNYFNSDEFKKKLQQYREMLQSGERVYFDADTLLDIAEYFDATHRHDLARDCANYAHQLHPDEALPLIYMARLSLDDGNLIKPNRWHRLSLKKNATNIIYYTERYFSISRHKQGKCLF